MTYHQPEFGKWRSFLWPVHGHELKKLIPMLLLFFFILFNYTILRDTKDTLVVTSSGAETILFLKFWAVVPSAIIFMLIYAKLSNMLSKSALFITTILPFIIFFAAFALVIYPNRELLHPHASADWLESVLPTGLKGLVSCYRDWTFSAFYVLSELWGSVVLSLLFWGFANDITRVTEAKRFYSLFGLGGNVALLVSGPLIVYFSNIRKHLTPDVDAWGMTLNYLMSLVVISGLCIIGVYVWMQKYVLTDPEFYDPNEEKKIKKAKPKLSVMDSLKYLATSKYVLCLAVIVMAYGMAINFVEITWKNQLKVQYPNPNDYSAFMGKFSTITGAITLFMMLFVGSNTIRRMGWTFSALATPVALLVTGIAFFSFIIFRDSLGGLVAAFDTTPVFMAVVFGTMQNVISKSTKYSLFDPTKEMAYIPLDQEQKVKGKAAVDVVGARVGKSGGAVVQQGLVLIFGTISAYTPYVAAILFVVIGAWIMATKYLGREFNKLTAVQPGTLGGGDAGSKNSASNILSHSKSADPVKEEAKTKV